MNDNYHKDDRPWGYFEQFTKNELCTVKILTVEPYGILSYQSHEKRDELWIVLTDDTYIVINSVTKKLSKGDRIAITRGTKHRLFAKDKLIQVLEISTGFFDEEDIVRYKDNYGR